MNDETYKYVDTGRKRKSKKLQYGFYSFFPKWGLLLDSCKQPTNFGLYTREKIYFLAQGLSNFKEGISCVCHVVGWLKRFH